MITRDPDASFDTPNVVIGRQGRNELTLSFRPAPYLHRLLRYLYFEYVGLGTPNLVNFFFGFFFRFFGSAGRPRP